MRALEDPSDAEAAAAYVDRPWPAPFIHDTEDASITSVEPGPATVIDDTLDAFREDERHGP